MAAGMLITGAIPASADPVAAWLKNNRQQLPRSLPELAALPLEVRSAVYQELTPAERSAAWVAQLTSHRLPTLTAEQSAVLGAALVLAANPANFAGAAGSSGGRRDRRPRHRRIRRRPRAGNLRHPRSERGTVRHHGQATATSQRRRSRRRP